MGGECPKYSPIFKAQDFFDRIYSESFPFVMRIRSARLVKYPLKYLYLAALMRALFFARRNPFSINLGMAKWKRGR